MSERAVQPGGFFARGIETITHRQRPLDHDLPELPDLQRLAPPENDRLAALEQLLPGPALEKHIENAIRPLVAEPEMLLPRPFARALVDAQEALRRASERHGSPAVLERAEKILSQEQAWRELAQLYREALHQA